mmetsp:Transcript_20749/g.31729  ORF Transcript_20749/g.31729 Transcript_20749/m.31729 type:complete len:132 (-) Transcript_20749:161-556(-)
MNTRRRLGGDENSSEHERLVVVSTALATIALLHLLALAGTVTVCLWRRRHQHSQFELALSDIDDERQPNSTTVDEAYDEDAVDNPILQGQVELIVHQSSPDNDETTHSEQNHESSVLNHDDRGNDVTSDVV